MSAGNEYEFRVIALNKGGESEPSPVSNTIFSKIRFIKPKINRDVFPSEKTAHADQLMKIEAEILAEPAPTINWYFPDGKPVTEGGRGEKKNPKKGAFFSQPLGPYLSGCSKTDNSV